MVLTPAKENDTAITFQWSAAAFGKQAAVSYILQLAVPADTANNWAKAKVFTVDVKTLRYAFIVKDLNNLLNGMGLTPVWPIPLP
ncbi:SusE domain-containing protein [Paraflavitalea speifideaquila]|uniref:SusE domain-containing protein n=1 Tax=Paraflavitalea speifideaquila TaxID=3076558 RepID=UPI0028E5748C|nr:SusE domain-containing protein [Paraflavitalea speifideiaquila]